MNVERGNVWNQVLIGSIMMCLYSCLFKRDLFITDHSKQTTFITDPFITDHVHNRPRSQQTTFIKHCIHNRPIMKVVSCERVCYERGLLWTRLLWTWSVSNSLLWTGLFWKGTVYISDGVTRRSLDIETHFCESRSRKLQVSVSTGLTIVANVVIATGPALLGAQRSSVINLIYYIIYKNLFSLGSQEVSILLNLP